MMKPSAPIGSSRTASREAGRVSLPPVTRAEHDYIRAALRRRYPDKPWRANFPEVDWEAADLLDAEAGLRAMLLAPTMSIYVALMCGEPVPIECLNASYVARFGKGAA